MQRRLQIFLLLKLTPSPNSLAHFSLALSSVALRALFPRIGARQCLCELRLLLLLEPHTQRRQKHLKAEANASSFLSYRRRRFRRSLLLPSRSRNQMTWTGAAPVAPPPGYDPAHPERDPVGAAAAREAAARASAVRVEKAKVRRESSDLKKREPTPSAVETLVRPFFPSTLDHHLSKKKNTKNSQKQLLREQLKKCYKESGVNHLQDCAELVDKYMSSIKGGSGTEVSFERERGRVFFFFFFFGFSMTPSLSFFAFSPTHTLLVLTRSCQTTTLSTTVDQRAEKVE